MTVLYTSFWSDVTFYAGLIAGVIAVGFMVYIVIDEIRRRLR